MTSTSHRSAGLPLPELKQQLDARIADIAVDLLGQPIKKRGNEWQFREPKTGSTSFYVNISTGAFHWFSNADVKGRGGLSLFISYLCHGDKRDGIAAARKWLGGGDLPPPSQSAAHTKRAANDDARKAAFKQRLIRGWIERSQPIDGTPAETYLRGRGVTPSSWPADVRFIVRPTPLRAKKDGSGPTPDERFHAEHDALMLIARDASGIPVKVQFIYLTPDGRKATPPGETEAERKLTPVKKTIGNAKDAALRLPATGTAVGQAIVLAEGPETGLSVWLATGMEVWVCLGAPTPLHAARVPLDRKLIYARDADPAGSPADLSFTKKITEIRRSRPVFVATPTEQPDLRKTDWNDILQLFGRGEVARHFVEPEEVQAQPFVVPGASLPSYFPPPDRDAAGAMEEQSRFIDDAIAHAGRRSQLNIEIDRRIDEMIVALRTAGNDQAALDLILGPSSAGTKHTVRWSGDGTSRKPDSKTLERLAEIAAKETLGDSGAMAPILRAATGSQGSGKTHQGIESTIQHMPAGSVTVILEPSLEQVFNLVDEINIHNTEAKSRGEPGLAVPVIPLRGRAALESRNSDTLMCPRAAAHEALSVNNLSSAALCSTKVRDKEGEVTEIFCEHYNTCGARRLLAQIEETKKQGTGALFVGSHEYALVPSAVPTADLLIGDEALVEKLPRHSEIFTTDWPTALPDGRTIAELRGITEDDELAELTGANRLKKKSFTLGDDRLSSILPADRQELERHIHTLAAVRDAHTIWAPLSLAWLRDPGLSGLDDSIPADMKPLVERIRGVPSKQHVPRVALPWHELPGEWAARLVGRQPRQAWSDTTPVELVGAEYAILKHLQDRAHTAARRIQEIETALSRAVPRKNGKKRKAVEKLEAEIARLAPDITLFQAAVRHAVAPLIGEAAEAPDLTGITVPERQAPVRVGRPIVTAPRKGDDDDSVDDVALLIRQLEETRSLCRCIAEVGNGLIRADMADADAVRIASAPSRRIWRTVGAVIGQTIEELKMGRIRSRSVLFDRHHTEVMTDSSGNPATVGRPRLIVHRRRKWSKNLYTPSRTSVLLLDGTGNHDHMQKAFPGLEARRIVVERRPGHGAYQVADRTFSKSSITGMTSAGTPLSDRHLQAADQLQRQIVHVVKAWKVPGDAFVVTNGRKIRRDAQGEPLEERRPNIESILGLRFDDACLPVRTSHFALTRGVNAYQDCQSGFVIGREETPTHVPETVARCWHWDDPDDTEEIQHFPEMVQVTRTARTRDGRRIPVTMKVHPDPRVQACIEQVREAEAVQGLDRVRGVRFDRRLMILGSTVLDVTLDRVMTMEEALLGPDGDTPAPVEWLGPKGRLRLALGRARKTGIFPLTSPGLAAMFPDIWSSPKDASNTLTLINESARTTAEAGLIETADGAVKRIIADALPTETWTSCRYRTVGSGGKLLPVLIVRHHNKSEMLARAECHLGELDRFELDGADLLAPAVEDPPVPPVDVLHEAMRLAADGHGILPLSAAELSMMFPNLFPNDRAVLNARRDPAYAALMDSIGTVHETPVIGLPGQWMRVEYRRPGQRGSPKVAVMRACPHAEAEILLSEVLGLVTIVSIAGEPAAHLTADEVVMDQSEKRRAAYIMAKRYLLSGGVITIDEDCRYELGVPPEDRQRVWEELKPIWEAALERYAAGIAAA